ncbi:myosin light chain kinase, smooth muscle isoform X1 [Alosa sapidissima]|uniref:myosin light chain kinase, smooth muscle isoform X1 n=1 Tax=Alosa sapidissima TaxID=34773 RepID=UPI001C085CD1|nr:myosin light chain kinase, smooth muscle isoform X1 [Alosa sapidissima]
MNEGKPKAKVHNQALPGRQHWGLKTPNTVLVSADVSKVLSDGSESVTTPPGGGPRTAGAPVLLSGLEDQTVMDGSLARMTVDVTGDPKPSVFWLHNGKEIMESEDFQFRQNGNECQLCIQDVFPEDSGKYIFVAWNHKGVVRTEAKLLVQEPAGGTRPWFIIRPKPVVTAVPGRHVLISCAIAGDPFPEFRWAKDGVDLASGGELRLVQKRNVVSLLIRRVASHHAGQYHIRLRNSVGQSSCTVMLSIRQAPDLCNRGPPLHSGGVSVGVGLADRTVRVSEPESCRGSRTSSQPQQARHQPQQRPSQQQQAERDSSSHLQVHTSHPGHQDHHSPRPLLRRHVHTRQCSEEQVREHQPKQWDFRSLLIHCHATKSEVNTDAGHSCHQHYHYAQDVCREQEPKDATMSMDFRSQLKKSGVRPSPIPKAEAAAPVKDFRAMLGKKGGDSPKAGPAGSGPGDFRAMLKKPAPGAEKNDAKDQTPTPKAPVAKDKQNGINGVPEKKDTPAPEKKGTAAAPAPEKKPSAADADKKPAASAAPEKKPAPAGKQPNFTQTPSDVSVVEGQRLQLQCEVTSDPAATITWSLDGKVIKPSKFIVLSQEGGKCSFTIDKALPEDAGRYTCKAENAAGKAECSCKVMISEPSDAASGDKKSAPTTENEALIKKKQAPKSPTKQGSGPQVTQFPGDLKILAGKKVDLLCNFTGAGPITCTWMKFKKPIQSGSGGITIETTENSSQLTIVASDPDHSGCYILELQNKFGTKQASCNLTVVDKPDPPARVPAVSDIRESSLTLSWYGPTYDGGSIVQSYNLEIWNSVDKKWTELASCNSTSYSVQKLLQDRQYKFRVRAVNMYGAGEPSAESVPTTVGADKMKETKEEEVEAADDDDDKEPEYRHVVVKKDCNVKELYEVQDRLGTGKFGQVYKLVEKSTKKVWAGKFIKAFSVKEKDNVRQEIDIMNSLHHPKLVQCVDAFEGKSDIVMVMEIISGGELFDRIVDEDFELSEREVIKYMLQIIDGVAFIHKQGIVHLDLKPENIMCLNKTGSKIKLIDFGLARRLDSAGGLKVLFGTPEFVAPEVINYEEIGYSTDMWSIGVICYILVSGLSPFMGDTDNETLSNVTSATWDFEDDAFDEISEECKDFISSLLKKSMRARLTCPQCLDHKWLKQDTAKMEAKQLSKDALKKYILRRKWQKTGNAVRAISRFHSMGMLGGVGPKKSPTAEDTPAPFLECAEDETRPPAPPTFTKVIRDVEVVEGSAARFDCKIEGCPDPDVVWYKDDQPIKETRHFQIDYEEDGHCSLVISEVCPEDDAKYTCKAVNSQGEASCTAELMVEFMQEEGEEGEGGEEEGEEEEEEE